MDKNAIKKYAVWARRELISRVSQKALQYGITEEHIVPANATSINGVVLSADEMKQRRALIAQINSKDYEQVMEEVAYTWFNRFIALRFMEVNGYLPSRVRVFTDENNAFNPQILTEAIFLEMHGLDMEKVYAYKDANDNDGLFKYLLIVQCNALSPVLPKMFQRISDYTELLFPDNLLREGSAIEQMISMIPEEDWKDAVQIIGWLYQYYNSEKKDEVFAALKKNVKITKENIPAATQLFTPDWIVRYMVENSLGRLWLEHLEALKVFDFSNVSFSNFSFGESNGGSISQQQQELKDKWKYYLDEAEQEPEVKTQLAEIRKGYKNIRPEDIKAIDPCAGSGHILAYMFDVLVQIYEDYGYTAREAVRSIIENNIYGLDIDDRAAQLAYFAVMMKGCQYDRRFLSRKDEDGNPDVPQPHVYAIVESNGLDSNVVDYFTNSDPKLRKDFGILCEELHDAKEYGSILNVSQVDFAALYARAEEVRHDISMFRDMALDSVLPLIQVAEALAQKYDTVATNPPYMGGSGMGTKLSEFVKKNYPDSKSDLFAVFIERCGQMAKKNGYQAMITQHAWMFLSSFEKLRTKLLTMDIVNMAHLGARAFEEIGGEVVQTTSFVIRKSHVADYKGEYCRLIEPTTQQGKEDMFLAEDNLFFAQQDYYSQIPGSPVAYWISEAMRNCYNEGFSFPGETKKGVLTGNDALFVRFWHEVNLSKIGFSCGSHADMVRSNKKWFPKTGGGMYRKWYGNIEDVVNLENDGAEIKATVPNYRLRDPIYYMREATTWTEVAGGHFSCRYVPSGVLFGNGGPVCFFQKSLLYTLGLLNSKVAISFLQAIAPTLNFGPEQINKVPFLLDKECKVEDLVRENIATSKTDWDSFETSWDFKRHPLVANQEYSATYHPNVKDSPEHHLFAAYLMWCAATERRFCQLKKNEEELNRIFIDIYGLQDELTPEVEDKDVTVRKADLQREIRSLISYAVGCMFGRYSLEVDGLAYAGGDWDEVYRRDRLADEHGNAIIFGGINLAVSKDFTQIKVDGEWKDCTFPVDADNIIPICDDEYFDDDVVGRFIRFIEVVYGKDTLQENLRFIADALGGSGQPKDVIRNYFLNDFYTDHLKIYQKRPIYWLFDSGKKGGFKALVYMHRYQPDTIARMRTDYVHEQQARYRTAIADLEQRIASASTSERVKLNKRLKKLQEQATEIQGYEEKIHHLADQYIAIDLDDGVKVNYAKFQDVLAKIK